MGNASIIAYAQSLHRRTSIIQRIRGQHNWSLPPIGEKPAKRSCYLCVYLLLSLHHCLPSCINPLPSPSTGQQGCAPWTGREYSSQNSLSLNSLSVLSEERRNVRPPALRKWAFAHASRICHGAMPAAGPKGLGAAPGRQPQGRMTRHFFWCAPARVCSHDSIPPGPSQGTISIN